MAHHNSTPENVYQQLTRDDEVRFAARRLKENKQTQLNWREHVPGEQEAIELAARYGNREYRRGRGRGGIKNGQLQFDPVAYRNKRNAKRRLRRVSQRAQR